MRTPPAIHRALFARCAPAITLLLAAHALAAPPTDPDRLAWQLFLTINKLAIKGESTTTPTVWETWPSTRAIYREDGADPGPLHFELGPMGAIVPGIAHEARFESAADSSPELTTLPRLRHIVAGRMVPGMPSAMDARRLIESRMNRIAFDYLRRHALYNLEGQMRAVASGRGVDFPRGSIDVKASWRAIPASDALRYRTIWVRFDNGEKRLYGLTALNLAAKVLPAGAGGDAAARVGTAVRQRGSPWLWASFEHIDNAHRVDGEGWQAPSRDRFACPHNPSDCDRVPAGLHLEGTAWQNYRLRGTLTDYVDSEGRPRRLGNSELEAGLQSTASCITCHARSAVAVVGGRLRRLPVFETNERSGSIGLPKPAWFRSDGSAYEPLDFVWSLSQAKPRRVVALVNQGRHDLPIGNLGDLR
jgi:hypothetical protein